MAKAKKIKIEVVTTIPGIALELTPEEALYLYQVLTHVGGGPTEDGKIAPRGHMDNIRDTLCSCARSFAYVPVAVVEGNITIESDSSIG